MISYKKHLFLISFLQVLIINSPTYAQEPKDSQKLDELKTKLERIQNECSNYENGETLFQDINKLKENTKKQLEKPLISKQSELERTTTLEKAKILSPNKNKIDEFLQEIDYAKYDCITQITWEKLPTIQEPITIHVVVDKGDTEITTLIEKVTPFIEKVTPSIKNTATIITFSSFIFILKEGCKFCDLLNRNRIQNRNRNKMKIENALKQLESTNNIIESCNTKIEHFYQCNFNDFKHIDLSDKNINSLNIKHKNKLMNIALPTHDVFYLLGWLLRQEGINFSYSNFANSKFYNANIPYANFTNATLVNAQFWDFGYDNLASNDSLQNANLRGASFVNANLKGANLTGANLKGANLTGANLEGANLTDATGLEVRQIQSAINWETAIYNNDFRQQLKLTQEQQAVICFFLKGLFERIKLEYVSFNKFFRERQE